MSLPAFAQIGLVPIWSFTAMWLYFGPGHFIEPVMTQEHFKVRFELYQQRWHQRCPLRMAVMTWILIIVVQMAGLNQVHEEIQLCR